LYVGKSVNDFVPSLNSHQLLPPSNGPLKLTADIGHRLSAGAPVPFDPVELTKQIKAACNIVDVVGSYLAVKPAGPVFKALCPFHNDSRPSLDIDPKRQRYKCWSCGAFGDVFAFVEKMEKVGFIEARSILASRVGIKLDERSSPQDHHRTHLLEVMRWAQAKYHHCLLESPIGASAVKYIAERKLSGPTIRNFGLGYAPHTLDCWLGQLALDEGIPHETLIEVGLLGHTTQNRGVYERFRDRIMFPIRDVRGQIIAFGGRIMPESALAARAPKYYNSAETPLFSKSDVLFGLDLARHAAASAGYLAVVEGYTDVMMAHQCGVTNVVATMGTALNSRHVDQLKRTVSKVVLVYDADAGGFTGVDRALEVFVSQDVELAVAVLPEGLDPCDLLVRSGGVDTFKTILASAVDALDFKLNRLLERNGASSVEGTRRVVDEVLMAMAAAPVLPSRTAQVKQELIITRLAHRLGLRQETVWARLGELKNERSRQERQEYLRAKTTPSSQTPPPNDGRTTSVESGNGNNAGSNGETGPRAGQAEKTERNLLQVLLADPGLLPKVAAAITPDAITHSGLRRILTELYAAQAAGTVPDIDALRERLSDRRDLFEAAIDLQQVGQTVQDRDFWLGKIIKRFAELKAEAEQRALKEQITGASDDQKIELLRKLQQNYVRNKKPGGDSPPR
jgi:DNA primase